ncbi:MAG: large conductance mechanosensitive channel protein MscL [Oscillatoriophycideae cyanobacterium NC_groundwater_1537_Pr4_S-0.65um_50_18]|nr:large conductance mechanosensitive channel protein MscL [Oscillatoriophycideae cyanobacterium NC_groundwater_1537_Pr4_S-0.65um_50_18]
MAASGNSGFWAEFRKFIMQGNVVDLAVAVIIGSAFGKIVESFVADIITPAILSPALKAANVDDLANLSANGIKYGSFLAAILNFLVIALSIFLAIRALEAAKTRFLRQKAAEEAAAPPDPIVVSQENLTHAVERLTQVMESR